MRPVSPSSVAEKKSVWRSCGQARTMRSTAGRKPMSSMRSASSRTRNCRLSKRAAPRCHQVLEPARGGDEHVGALAGLDLLLEADAAVDGRDLEAADAGQRLGLLDDLGGELARRGEHERGGAAAAVLEALDDRDHEGERLAGARGGLGEHVAAGEHVTDDEALDREGLGDAALGESLLTRVDTPRSAKVRDIGFTPCGHWPRRFGRLTTDPNRVESELRAKATSRAAVPPVNYTLAGV